MYTVVTWSPSTTKKQDKENRKLFRHGEELTIFLMNIEAFSTKKGLAIAQKFLLAHQCLMAIDESTTIKSPTASRTKNVLKLRDHAKYRRILTGSPVTKSPLDLYTQCYFLDPYYLDFSSYYTFKNRYAMMVDRNVGSHSFKLVTGYIRLDELNSKLENFSYRVLKEDCLDLPDKVYMKRSVPLSPEQLKAYVEMKKHALTELEGSQTTAASALAQMIRLHQITCGHLATDDGEVRPLKNNRISELLNILEEVDGKLLFGRYTVMILKKLQTYFQKNMERTVWRLSLVILLIAIAKILLLASKIEKALYDFLWAIQEPEGMVSLLLLVTLLCITVTAMI